MTQATLRVYPNGLTMVNLQLQKSTARVINEMEPGECRWESKEFPKSEPLNLCQFVKDISVELVNANDGIKISNMKSESAPYLAHINDPQKSFRALVSFSKTYNCYEISAILP